MLDKLKQYSQYILGGLLFIVTGAFLYEKSKKDSAEALNADKKTLDQVAELQKTVDANDGKLASEEQKREEIKKAADDAKHDTSDPSTFLSKR